MNGIQHGGNTVSFPTKMRFIEATGEEVINEHYLMEGAKSPDELRKVLEGICRGNFNPKKIGIVHLFGEKP